MRHSPALRQPAVRRVAATLAAVILVTAGYTAGASRAGHDARGAGSVDVGFVRDMVVHHGQAVTLAMIVLRRATLPGVREMAGDIATTQQLEAGTMIGWLQQWSLPASTTAPAMAWMSHAPVAGDGDPPMPGMATREDVARLAVTRGRSADLLFCRLMLQHHLGGLHMIDEETRRGSRPEVVALATDMGTAQRREINQLQRLLAQLEPPAPEQH
jgi:uncharacterized protein (DUF305 family)